MKSIRKQENESPPSEDAAPSLPARQRQTTALLQVPGEGIKLIIEEGATIYFGACRRLAKILNRRKS